MRAMTFSDLRNDTDHEFTDISSEAWRCYEFVDWEVRIKDPIALSVSESGGHRVLDAQGHSYYIKPSFLAVYWRARDDAPHFVK